MDQSTSSLTVAVAMKAVEADAVVLAGSLAGTCLCAASY